MKKYRGLLYFATVLLICYSCATTNNSNKDLSETAQQGDTIKIVNDSLEYDIIIIEPGFNSYLVTQQPRGYYSLNFLKIRNNLYVQEYNRRVLNPFRFDPNVYIQQINYESRIDYGYEVNYLLYNWFQFLEDRNNINFFISRGRGR